MPESGDLNETKPPKPLWIYEPLEAVALGQHLDAIRSEGPSVILACRPGWHGQPPEGQYAFPTLSGPPTRRLLLMYGQILFRIPSDHRVGTGTGEYGCCLQMSMIGNGR
jgi:hypothetical protein